MNQRYLPLIIALALPIIFLVVLTVVIYLPKVGIKPTYDFIYTASTPAVWDGATYRYEVVDDRIVANVVLPRNAAAVEAYLEPTYPTLYRYNIKENTVKELSFEEARLLSLDPGPSSPDGYTITYNYGHNGIFELFGSSNNNRGYFIIKDNVQKKLPGIGGNDYWRDSIEVVGWITQ